MSNCIEAAVAFIVMICLLLLPGCAATPKPDVQIQINAPVGEKPEYTVTIRL